MYSSVAPNSSHITKLSSPLKIFHLTGGKRGVGDHRYSSVERGPKHCSAGPIAVRTSTHPTLCSSSSRGLTFLSQPPPLGPRTLTGSSQGLTRPGRVMPNARLTPRQADGRPSEVGITSATPPPTPPVHTRGKKKRKGKTFSTSLPIHR